MGRALVVDDELDICLMVTKHLENLQFNTQYALTVKEARAKLNEFQYELIFIDLNLPDGSGYDIIAAVQELNVNARIIVISAYDGEAEKSLSMGATLFVNKPFTIKTINEALKTLHFLPI